MKKHTLCFIGLFMVSTVAFCQSFNCTQVYHPKEDAPVWYLQNQNNPTWGPTNTTNYGDTEYLDTQVWTWNASPGKKRSYIAVDLLFLNDLSTSYVNQCYLNLFNPFSGEAFSHKYSSGKSNVTRIYKVTQSWHENSITWDNQPDFEDDEYTEIGIIPSLPNTESHEHILNIDITPVVLDENHHLEHNYHGIVMMQWTEDLSTIFHKMNFASKDYPDSDYWPQLCINYEFPEPVVLYNGINLTVAGVDELENLFYNHVSYYWLINSEEYYGKTIAFETDNIDELELLLMLKITNNIGQHCEYEFSLIPTTSEKQINAAVKLHPNPAKTQFGIISDTPVKSVTIVDSMGKTRKHIDNYSNYSNIDICGFEKGIITVIIDTQQGIITKLLVVE